MELQLLNEVVQFHTPNGVQYIVSKIPKIEEELPGYNQMSFVVVTEPWETFFSRVMK